jgi:hypothetical protein
MKAIVVYESLWGNTAAIARAIAEGIGAEARALSTAEATAEAIAGADLLVAGAPLHAFGLPTEQGRASAAKDKNPPPADLSHPPVRSWLKTLPSAQGHVAAFETRFRFSPGSAAKPILRRLQRVGYHPIAKGERFIVTGTRGPLQDGELERARQWGAELVKALG